jgi:hydrogenase nickel incorporation protein HypA/HybF
MIPMHESHIAKQLLEIMTEKAKINHAHRITKAYLRLGNLPHAIAPDSLEAILHEMAKGTLAESAQFQIDEMKLHAYCPDCRRDMLLEHPVAQCPYCYSINIKFAHQPSSYVEAIEVE